MATTATEWKKGKQGIELKVPSGNTCLARRVGMDVFLREGMVPNTLLPIIRQAMNTGEAPKLELNDIDDTMLLDIMRLVDAVTVYVIQEPAVQPAPAAGVQREDDVLYVDDVDLDDKMFIFNWAVGGTADLERFRAEQGSFVGALRPGADVERAPELPGGTDG
jgi:hypothetical protein